MRANKLETVLSRDHWLAWPHHDSFFNVTLNILHIEQLVNIYMCRGVRAVCSPESCGSLIYFILFFVYNVYGALCGGVADLPTDPTSARGYVTSSLVQYVSILLIFKFHFGDQELKRG